MSFSFFCSVVAFIVFYFHSTNSWLCVPLQVVAVDSDIGKNGLVNYFRVDGHGSFDVRSDSGEIVVNRPLRSLRKNTQIRLVVEARDKGF